MLTSGLEGHTSARRPGNNASESRCYSAAFQVHGHVQTPAQRFQEAAAPCVSFGCRGMRRRDAASECIRFACFLAWGPCYADL